MCMVSVIVPYYNRSGTLTRALESVRAQTYKDYEIILVNDGSNDQSQQLVEDYIKQHAEMQFKHIIQANTGPSGARNNGIRHARGQYIAFLDSDDAWEPAKLETQLKYMENNPHLAITGTNYYIVKSSRQPKFPAQSAGREISFYHLLFKSFYLTSTVMVRSKIFRQDNIWFRLGKHQGEDLLLFLQIHRKYRGGMLYVPLSSLFKFEFGESGLTCNLNKLLAHELDNMKILYSENDYSRRKINFSLFILLNIYTYLKHTKRLMLTGWRKARPTL